MSAHRNSQWICQVRECLREGLGVEDIAIKLQCHVDDVRAEVSILREQGDLARVYGGKK